MPKKKAAPTRKKTTPTQPADSRIDPDREVRALEARIKLRRGEKISRQAERDVQWLKSQEAAILLDEWKAAVPKGEYCQLASRQHKLVDDAARNYNLPLGNATINLRDAITGLHDLVASNAHRLRSQLDGDLDQLKEEKIRQEILKLEKENERMAIELEYSRGDAIPRSQVREGLLLITARLRTLGQTLARVSPDARDALNTALEAIADELDKGNLAF